MFTTTLTVATLAALLLAQLAATAFFLRLGSRWAKIGNVTFLRALWAIVAASLVSWIPGATLDRIPCAGVMQAMLMLALELVLSLGLTWIVIARVLKTGTWRAAWAWIPTLIPHVGFVLLLLFGVRPYLFEPFKVPTNSMAPTLLGRHWESPCPRCGSPAYATPEPAYQELSQRPVLMVCSKEFRACEMVNPPHTEFGGDRFLVCKLIALRRWDVVVFRYPQDPSVLHCQRLVGLPGETVTISDGAVWIDGKRQSPPEGCKGLEYLAKIKDWSEKLWGSPSKPARLGPDEYFVLGDFSANAFDSRLWQTGAPGHPPYAVPESYLIGVVTHIYWPPSRWRVLR
jgi:signal peptidase I